MDRRWIAEPTYVCMHACMSNKWRVIVPVEVLHCVFDLGAEIYCMLAGWANDALDCFKLFHTALGSPCNADCWFHEDSLTYPSDLPNGVHMGIGQLLTIIAEKKGVIANNVPAVLVLSILPYALVTEAEAAWMDICVSELDATIDLAPFFQCGGHSEFTVKAVVYHLHPADRAVVLNSGHYVAYLKQAGGWHLANDSLNIGLMPRGLRMAGNTES